MAKAKTQKQIDAEIKALKDLKPRIRRFSAFGDDHWKTIDAQLAVLERNLDEDDIGAIYPDSDLNSAAYDTIQWRKGAEVDESPAEGWKELIRA